jgi:hypothetical protein
VVDKRQVLYRAGNPPSIFSTAIASNLEHKLGQICSAEIPSGWSLWSICEDLFQDLLVSGLSPANSRWHSIRRREAKAAVGGFAVGRAVGIAA